MVVVLRDGMKELAQVKAANQVLQVAPYANQAEFSSIKKKTNTSRPGGAWSSGN